METILVVDDEKNYLLVMATLLEDEGFKVLTAESGEHALKLMESAPPDLILTDMKMPGIDGIELLSRAKAIQPELPVIMMTAFGTVEKAVEAMKRGAFDYITKPFQNEELMITVRKALSMSQLVRENRELTQALRERYSFGNLIGKSKPMLEIYRLVEKVSDTRANVLITGESGTGKELIAKAIHYHSPRSQGPFVAVNCSALAESLLESELFGHEKGAFTDARSSRKGRFELSDGGSLFLDEIGEMSTNLQAKLLRVLQERQFERVGGTETIEVNVRVIAATNRDLKQEISAGRFREDLFYRLNVVHVHVPPLRKRTDDIPLLVSHFVKEYSKESGKKGLQISPKALRALYGYPWPGNVRELENAIERAVILCSGHTVELDDLPEDLLQTAPDQPASDTPRAAAGNAGPPSRNGLELDAFISPKVGLNEALEAVEMKLIQRALNRSGGVQAQAADLLGIAKNLMQYKLKKYPPDLLARGPDLDLDVDRFIPPNWDLNQALDAVEKGMIARALEACGGIQAQAAELLGTTKRVVQYKVKKFGL